MPIYEYECAACGAREEHLQSMREAPKEICQACGAPKLARMISHSSFHLKGGGWYKDGYASTGAAGGKSDD